MRLTALVACAVLVATACAPDSGPTSEGLRADARDAGKQVGLSLVDSGDVLVWANQVCETASWEASPDGPWTTAQRLAFLDGCRDMIGVLR